MVSSGDTLNLQCPTLTILDTRQWASMWKKSLAHKDRPLAQKKKCCPKKKMWDTEISWPLITSKQKLFVPMATADLLICEHCCLRIHKFIHSSFFLQWIAAMGMFCSNLVENFLRALISHFFYSSCCVCPLVNNNNLPRNHWPLKDSFSKKSCQKKLEIFLIPALNLRKKIPRWWTNGCSNPGSYFIGWHESQDV